MAAVAKGAVAGVAGTLAMDLLMWRREGGDQGFLVWESSDGLDGYDQAPAPAQVGRRIVEGYLQRPLPPGSARLMNNAMHLLTGAQWGVVHGLVAGSSGRRGPLAGIRTGLTAWLASYALLAPAGLYDPIWTYPLPVLAKDASAHLAYGMGTSITFGLLAGRRAGD